MINFLTREGELNLKAISTIVEAELLKRARELGEDFAVHNFQDLVPTDRSTRSIPHKYTAKSQAEITYQGKPLGSGKVTSVLFRPGEGTGDCKTMQIDGVVGAWTPRKKEGYAEIFMALGTGYDASRWISGLISLDRIVSYDAKWVVGKAETFNVSMPGLRDSCKDDTGGVEGHFPQHVAPRFGLTYLQHDAYLGRRLPHSIVFHDSPTKHFFEPEEAIFQIASFLPFPERKDFEVIREANELLRAQSG